MIGLQIGIFYISYPYINQPDCSIFMTGGQAYFILYVILGFLLEFVHSLVNILLTLGTIIFLTKTLEIQISIKQVLLGMVLIFLFCLTKYYIEWLNRRTFLLTCKDQQWVQIFQRLTPQPFILFEFDQFSFGFNLTIAGNTEIECSNTQELRLFLRESFLHEQSLEQYLFKINQNNSEGYAFCNSLIINYQKRKYKIKISMSTIIQNQYLITFEKESQIVSDLKQQCNNKQKQLLNVFKNFTGQLLYMFTYAIKKRTELQTILQQLNEYHLSQLIYLENQQYQLITLSILINQLNKKVPFKLFFTKQPSMTNIRTILDILILLIGKLSRLLKSQEICISIKSDSIYQSNLSNQYTILSIEEKDSDYSSLQSRDQEFLEYKDFYFKRQFVKIAQKVSIAQTLFQETKNIRKIEIHLIGDSEEPFRN